MELTLLMVAGCPHAALFEERLGVALAAHPGTALRRRVVASEGEAVAAGMHGSPTLLVDGVDPFARPGEAASLSCRLYPAGSGAVPSAPADPGEAGAMPSAPADPGEAGAVPSAPAGPGEAGAVPSVAALREALSRPGRASSTSAPSSPQRPARRHGSHDRDR
jgi:hypothetical protein